MPYTKAQKAATQKYLAAKKEQLRIWVDKGQVDSFKKFAADNGFSLAALVVGLLDSAMRGDIPLPPKE